MTQTEAKRYDVVIAGGGLAGLTLARQLRMADPGLSVLVIEKQARPLPEAAFKVGESSIEVGAHYFAKQLGLEDYIKREHFIKLGLRYFYRARGEDFASRPEFGVADWLPIDSYQLDRGKLESHLRDVVVADGAELLEGASVSDVVLAEDDGDHRVFLQHDGRSREVTCRWLADASGRRALLRRKLGLEKDIPGRCSSAWFRLDGRLSVDTFVPEERADWHRRVRQDRYFSTNHLMGPGYWVWLIPLAPHFTSVGIVTMEEVEPFDGYNTMEKARDWLVRHEPLVAEAIKPYGILDFRVMRRYSHTVHRVFSAQRWSCVGDAGAFVDPYYSVGSNMIGFANSMTTRMVMLDRQGQLTEQLVDHYNTFYLSIIEALTFNIQITYPCHENAQVMALKTIWDFYVGWSIADPQFYHQLFFDPVKSRVIADVISRQVATQQKMMALFRQWAERSAGRQSLFFDFIDYIEDLPTLRALFLRNQVREGAPFSEILDDFRRSVDRVEELAHVVFFMAVEDVLPDALPLLRARGGWFNTAAIGLDPDAWERDGLFAPVTERRDISPLDSEIRRLFRSSADRAA